eukprot:scaffold314083_cov51-Attheya_sp.AAC.2
MVSAAVSDDGFIDYVEKTTDPGYSVLIVTLAFCIASQLLLSYLVILHHRRKRKQDGGEGNRDASPSEGGGMNGHNSCQAQAELADDKFSDESYLPHMYRGAMPSSVESDPQGRGNAQRVQKSRSSVRIKYARKGPRGYNKLRQEYKQ